MNLDKLLNKALLHHQQGKVDLALPLYNRLLKLKPSHIDALHLKGVALHQQGKHKIAIPYIEKAIQLKPDHHVFHNNLGLCYQYLKDEGNAYSSFEKALSLKADYAEAHNNIGVILREQQIEGRAEQHFLKALKLIPGYAEALNNLAILERDRGHIDLALAYFEQARLANPRLLESHLNAGVLLLDKGRTTEAQEAFKQAHQINPDDPETLLMLGNFELEMGMLDRAQAFYQQGLNIDPKHPMLLSNRLFAANYQPDISQKELFSFYQDWASKFETGIEPVSIKNEPEANKRINIAFLSADFRQHASSYFIEPLLSNLKREEISLFAVNSSRQRDSTTDRIRHYFDHWKDIAALEDREVAEWFVSQGIDILIDLAGHTRGQRLGLIAMKPCPVIISWLGYGYTTGLKAVDYFIADKHFVPDSDQQWFSESIHYIDRSPFCYRPPVQAPAQPPALPAKQHQYVTFGCLSRPVRINYKVIHCWSEVLKSIPGSRLRLDHPAYSNPMVAEHFQHQFFQQGINESQIEMVSSSPHWSGFAPIDIILDPFPHHSGTTTFEALWMGRPVISQTDRAPLGRFGNTLLNAISCHHWIAQDEKQYLEIASEITRQIYSEEITQEKIKQKLANSSLMDETGFADSFYYALKSIWHKWCISRKKNSSTRNIYDLNHRRTGVSS